MEKRRCREIKYCGFNDPNKPDVLRLAATYEGLSNTAASTTLLVLVCTTFCLYTKIMWSEADWH